LKNFYKKGETLMNRGVFLDRDGVINEVLTKRVKYVNTPQDLYLLPGVQKAMRMLTEAGFQLFIVTNQGGVGLGYMTKQLLDKIHEKLIYDIEIEGGKIVEIACCIHRPNEGCACRKPSGKMIRDLAQKYNIDLSQSYMVGDRDVDLLAGREAGTKTVWISTRQDDSAIHLADYTCGSLLEAAQWILNE
jgi:D-glycero-D-manno-heptose 1,7-bisphosphate phosphatase